jgi:hypothetical protein
MSRKPREIGNPTLATAVLAERVALLYGWTAISNDDSDRAKALHAVWSEWYDAYRAAGGSGEPRRHPVLSDALVKELADKQRRHEAEMRAAVNRIVVVEPR